MLVWKIFDLNFTFCSKVKGAGMAFDFGFGKTVLFGAVCPARVDQVYNFSGLRLRHFAFNLGGEIA